MSFFNRLLGALRGGKGGTAPDEAGGRNAFWVYVRCAACGEPIRVRINREHDLSAEYEEGRDAPSAYHVHKEVVGQQCFRRIQVDITFDGVRQISDQQIQGGTYLTREAYEAAVAEQSSGAPPSSAPPASTTPPAS